MGNNKIWIIAGAVAVVVLGGWFFMANNDEAEGVIGDPVAIEEPDTPADQDTDEDDDEN